VVGVKNSPGGKMNSEAFRELQKDLGLDAADMAEELGVSVRTVERYRSGKHKIPKKVAHKLLEMHGYYFGRQGDGTEEI
jgi:predicted transcriptional regulator